MVWRACGHSLDGVDGDFTEQFLRGHGLGAATAMVASEADGTVNVTTATVLTAAEEGGSSHVNGKEGGGGREGGHGCDVDDGVEGGHGGDREGWDGVVPLYT